MKRTCFILHIVLSVAAIMAFKRSIIGHRHGNIFSIRNWSQMGYPHYVSLFMYYRSLGWIGISTFTRQVTVTFAVVLSLPKWAN